MEIGCSPEVRAAQYSVGSYKQDKNLVILFIESPCVAPTPTL